MSSKSADVMRVAPIGAALLAAACASSQGEEVRDARFARIDADAEVAQTQIDRREQARSDEIATRFSRLENRVEDADRPAEEANETLVDLRRNRAEYASHATARLNKLAVRINAAKEKIDVLGPRAPLSLHTELETAAQQYNLIKQDVIQLPSTAPSEWNATTREIDEKTAKLDDRVSRLNESIEDV